MTEVGVEWERGQLGEIYPLFAELWTLTHDEAQRLAYDQRRPSDLALAALYGTIVEQIETVHFLLTNNKYPAIQNILRSVMEACIDLQNLCEVPGYLDRMEFTYFKDLKALLDAGLTRDNPFAITLRTLPFTPQQLVMATSELARLKTANVKALTIREKFELADKLDEYEVLYKVFCGETHNNISALTRRHLAVENGRVRLKMFERADIVTELMMLNMMTDLFLSASLVIHQNFDTPSVALFRDFKERIALVRAAPKP